MEMKFCQSCGMPLTPEISGTNADGSKNEEYRQELDPRRIQGGASQVLPDAQALALKSSYSRNDNV